jgi:hypothetical protein
MNCVRLFVALYCGTIALIVALRHVDQLRYVKMRSSSEPTAKIAGWWSVPRVTVTSFNLVAAALVGCLALAAGASGPISRCALFLSAILYFLYFGQILGVSYVHRKSNLIPQVLLILALAPGATSDLNSHAERWPLILIQALVAQVYLSSSYCKLRNMGLAWARGYQLQGVLLLHHMYYDLPLSATLAESLLFCKLLSGAVVVLESTFWMPLLVPQSALVYAGCGLLFHIATLILMRIDYLTYHCPVYLVFVVTPLAGWLTRS